MFTLLRDVGLIKNLSGVFTGEGMPRFLKKSGVLKTAKSGNFETPSTIS